MCHRFTLAWSHGDLCERFRVPALPEGLVPHYSVAPGSPTLVIAGYDRAEAALMQWGLVPHRARDVAGITPPANARAESLAERPMFRDLLQEHRCLVPASGFFEWKQQGKAKVPYYFRIKDDPVFAFAGLYDVWHSPAGETLATFTLVTTAPNALVATVHPRMPAILRREDESRWLSRDLLSDGELRRILSPFPAVQMEGYEVTARADDPAADDERVIMPVCRL